MKPTTCGSDGVMAWRRGGVAAWRRGGVAWWWRGSVVAWRAWRVRASGRCVARRGEGVARAWRACHEMEVAVWFSQSLYMIILAVTVQNVKNT